MTDVMTIERCVHEVVYTACQRCTHHPAASYKDGCRCPSCKGWRHAYDTSRPTQKPVTKARTYPNAKRMRGFWIDVTCPECGGPVLFVAGSHGTTYEQRANVVCRRCHLEHVVVVVMLGQRGGRVKKPLTA
jgi:transposase InsO family protein